MTEIVLKQGSHIPGGKQHDKPTINLFPNSKFRLFQTERVGRQQFQNLMKMADTSPKKLENTVGNGQIACYEF